MVADLVSKILFGAAVYVVVAVILFALLLVGSDADDALDFEEWERRSAEPDELEALRRRPGR